MLLLRSITTRKLRTFLTVLGVGLALGAMVALLGVSTSLVKQVSAVVSGADSQLTVVQRIPQGLTFGYLGSLPESVVDQLKRMLLETLFAGCLGPLSSESQS